MLKINIIFLGITLLIFFSNNIIGNKRFIELLVIIKVKICKHNLRGFNSYCLRTNSKETRAMFANNPLSFLVNE